MKTLEQFVKDNEGQFLEVAGSSNAKNQCVDCVNGYIRDVLGLPIIEWTNAIDFKNKANGNYDIIYNDLDNPNLVPEVGDIVVYKHPNKIGHIGVCIKKGTSSSFGIFEENWPVGSPCKSVLNKKYIIGDYVVDYWMRPKNVIIDDMTDIVSELIKTNGITEGDIRWLIDLKANQTVSNLEKQIEELKEKSHEYEVEIQTLLAEITEYQKEIVSKQKELDSAKKSLEMVSNNLENMTTDRDNWRSLYNKKNDQYNQLLDNKITLFSKIFSLVTSFVKKLRS